MSRKQHKNHSQSTRPSWNDGTYISFTTYIQLRLVYKTRACIYCYQHSKAMASKFKFLNTSSLDNIVELSICPWACVCILVLCAKLDLQCLLYQFSLLCTRSLLFYTENTHDDNGDSKPIDDDDAVETVGLLGVRDMKIPVINSIGFFFYSDYSSIYNKKKKTGKKYNTRTCFIYLERKNLNRAEWVENRRRPFVYSNVSLFVLLLTITTIERFGANEGRTEACIVR